MIRLFTNYLPAFTGQEPALIVLARIRPNHLPNLPAQSGFDHSPVTGLGF